MGQKDTSVVFANSTNLKLNKSICIKLFFYFNHITKCFCLRQIELLVGSEYQEVQTTKLYFQLNRQGHVRRNHISDPSAGGADSF